MTKSTAKFATAGVGGCTLVLARSAIGGNLSYCVHCVIVKVLREVAGFRHAGWRSTSFLASLNDISYIHHIIVVQYLLIVRNVNFIALRPKNFVQLIV